METANLCSLYVTPAGEILFIYDDTIAEHLNELGNRQDERIGLVEPDKTGWFIKESPITDKVIGPFNYRKDAIEKEVELVESYLDHLV